MFLQFEWDPKKAEANLEKHGVFFEEALTVFADPLARIFDDEEHSNDERREIIIGHSTKSRLVLVCFTTRGTRIRLFSARRATQLERKDYEENVGS
jgi:uncharacterized DUF497 family protein